MLNNNIIAITTTVYNDSTYIKKLLTSLLNQSMTAFSHYILEDGSTDTSEKIVEWYKKEIRQRNLNIKVTYIKNNYNLGVNKGHELLFRMVKEQYFCWIDADDWVVNNFISVVTKYIEQYPNIDIFHVNSSQYNLDYTLAKESTMSALPENIINSIDQFPAYCVGGEKFFHNFIVKTSAFKKINPDIVFFESRKIRRMWYDSQLLFEMCLCHSSFKMIKEPLSCILNRPYSLSRRPLDNNHCNPDKIDCKEHIICNLPFSKRDISFYRLLKDLSSRYYEKLSIAHIKDDVDDAFTFYREYKRFVKKNRLPSNYINLYLYIPNELIKAKHPFFYRMKRKAYLLKKRVLNQR